MAWRANEDDVRTTLEDDFPASIRLAPHLDTATALTDRIAAQDSDSVLSAAILKRIEMYLAGHFATGQSQGVTEEKTADASAKYQGEYGKRLEGTWPGQQALLLDETGFLDKLNRADKIKGTFGWLGTPPSSQTAYVDRD